ncbi:helix-turn-helix transcriptional regulator [Lactobacillus crispatus]|uniref:helix-turn-helix domain-containing protein n=1 Tax=Lactobacillus crispatus TaxID=47770 RepID=UPI001C4E2564|nr:helix-turn-helix transcriptional regulator [Lactobacillus crispatus]MBW0437970.1 helix-turn-helix transcriptional regulator [Lactobacillus crispatus]MBW0444521.1 helix-turn-helix transcriptional regulator [Lactobacillus crispatus]MBW0456192.1 helix-turn-helix transcriptional regulator [Lactobacillus crispatus]
MSVFSNRLKTLRENAGWTKTYVATLLHLPLTTYANYEYGKREPDIDTIAKISTLFNTSTDYLMGKTDNPFSNDEKDINVDTSQITYKDLGLPYKGVVADDVNDMYRAIAEAYAKKHNLPKRDD